MGYGATREDVFSAVVPISGWYEKEKAQQFQISVWAFHCGDDDVVPVSGTVDMIEALQVLKKEVKRDVSDLHVSGTTPARPPASDPSCGVRRSRIRLLPYVPGMDHTCAASPRGTASRLPAAHGRPPCR